MFVKITLFNSFSEIQVLLRCNNTINRHYFRYVMYETEIVYTSNNMSLRFRICSGANIHLKWKGH